MLGETRKRKTLRLLRVLGVCIKEMHCFVCHEETVDTCACACKPHVHKSCLLKTIETRQNLDCSICAQPIQNVGVRTERYASRAVACFAVALASTIASSAIASMLLLALAVDDRQDDVFYDLLICCASCVFVATCASRLLQKLLREHDLTRRRQVYCFI